MFARDQAGVTAAFEALHRAIVIGDALTERPAPLVSHRVTKAGVEELVKERAAKPRRRG